MPEDPDPRETQEWLEALDSVVEFDGVERAKFLLKELQDGAAARCAGAVLGEHPVYQHHPGGQAAAAPGRSRRARECAMARGLRLRGGRPRWFRGGPVAS